MSILVIRHGLSEANNRENIGTLAFASWEAPLMEQGRLQAAEVGNKLLANYGLDPSCTTVATSELRRTQETAERAGFQTIVTYALLNEIAHGVRLPELRGLLDRHKLPKVALDAAEAILEAPPKERVWVTHGLVISSLCAVLGIHQTERFIPRFCEIRELPITHQS